MQQVKASRASYPYKADLNAGSNTGQTTLWIGGLETWEDESYLYLILQQILPLFCVITNITVVRDVATEISLGYGFVDFMTHQAAEAALQICRKAVRPGHSRPFRISWAASNTFSHKRAASTMLAPAAPVPTAPPTTYHAPPANVAPMAPVQQAPPPNENLTLYVTPLEKHITKFTLAEEIKKFGYTSIVSIKIAHNANGISRGFGFIRFGNRDELNDALERLKTLRLGESQQPLHVTTARCNSYDPENTFSNEVLFGNSGQHANRRNGNSQVVMHPKRQRRMHYGNGPGHVAPQQQMMDMQMAATNPHIMVNKIPPPGNYLQSNMAIPPPAGGQPQYVMAPMVTIPAPPSSTTNYSTTYSAPPSSTMPQMMSMANMVGPNSTDIAAQSAASQPLMGSTAMMAPMMPMKMSAPQTQSGGAMIVAPPMSIISAPPSSQATISAPPSKVARARTTMNPTDSYGVDKKNLSSTVTTPMSTTMSNLHLSA